MTAEKAYETACSSQSYCQQYGITGRCFANTQHALLITEGPKPVLDFHYMTIQKDPLVQTVLLHVDRVIPEREFSDFSVWLNLNKTLQFSDHIFALTAENVKHALPENPSPRLRIMAEAYLDDDMLSAN